LYKIPATTLFLGKKLIFMPECHSTNDHLLLLCQDQSLPEGSAVITSNQTAGRGQRGNSWEAQPFKNLTFSILLKPSFLPVLKQFYLTMVVSLGIRDYLTEETNGKVHIKWPNDILVEEKKICGILIENQITGQKLSGSIIGVGLNVNQQYFGINTATSMMLVTGQQYDLPVLFENVLSKIEARYLQLREGKLDLLKEAYLNALYLRNRSHTFYSGNAAFTGVITGIDEIGRLKVETDKVVKTFDIKEIRYGSLHEDPLYS
jgi:BirA family transcriptional regulator, biotin operon repressor / biotin---[acetyl-CoA-carboxylase] ligase